MVIVYAETLRRADDWIKRNIKVHDRKPIAASPELHNCFIGAKGAIILLINIDLPLDLIHRTKYNTVIYVKE